MGVWGEEGVHWEGKDKRIVGSVRRGNTNIRREPKQLV
jgi:hypothetical protein